MEKDFQTSFIPKKPIMEERVVASAPTSLFLIISIFILFTVLVATGGLYFYKGILQSSVTKMQNDLTAAKNRFEPAKIKQLQELDKRLSAATQVLSNHVAISPIFQALQDVTMKSIRYTKFGYTFSSSSSPDNAGGINSNSGQKVNVKLAGTSTGYLAVALQADLFSQDKFLIDPVFSNLNLDDNGNVTFDLEFSVDPTFIDYKKIVLNNDGTENITTDVGTSSSITTSLTPAPISGGTQ